MNLSIRTSQAARRHGNRIAIVDGDRQWTYLEFEQLVDQLASGLADTFPAGSRIAVMMTNRAEAIMLQFALERANLVRVPVNFRYTAHELAKLATHCSAAAVLHDGPCALVVQSAKLDPATRKIQVDDHNAAWMQLRNHKVTPQRLHLATPDTLASINYTSGSTGAPKGVMLSHGNWAAVYRNMLIDRGLRADDVVAYVGPLTHSSGSYLAPWYWCGARNVIVTPSTPARLLDLIEQEHVTAFTCVPTFLTKLLAQPGIAQRDLSSLRLVGYGAEAMPANTLERAWALFGPVLWQNYGQTEAMMTCAHLSPQDHMHMDESGQPAFRHGFIGRPYTFVEIVLRDEQGQPVPSGQVGELTVRGEHVMQGYWEQADATAKTIRDGWLWTGDLAVADDQGLLRLVGRSKDMLICGGFNIYPSEIELLLTGLDHVREAAVIARPDQAWGEVAVAFVVAEPESTWTHASLAAASRAILGIKTPKAWHLVPELPKTGNGKIDKRELRRLDAQSLLQEKETAQ
ncbi:AMP-binding protein [Pusillimonas sp. SM2304]|uniref:class I adenylate-forming enzyme family protein n=1 Tax=Pusillimonas sp. SM2304 TaxID=3073241 RepID=UPI002875DBD2|nr:AMP-binding protein [Pusillimonas sp. SM2304]MDS1140074.1 AMP-binding protein [Pusillimonas sp. SM2304]